MQKDRLLRAFGFAERISRRKDMAAAATDIGELARDYGFSTYILAAFTGPGSLVDPYILSSGWNEEWQDRYFSKDYVLDDPTVARALRSFSPFKWGDTKSDPGVSDRGKQILEEARSFDMKDGVFIPVHGPRGFEGTLVFGGEEADVGSEDLKALHLAGLYAYSHVLDLAKPKIPSLGRETVLTKRETECIKWSAVGKTSSDIAELLGISRHTADWYLKEATRKLGAANRTHAVAAAFRTGLIT